VWTFLACSVVGFLVLIIRRVFVKGELGGTSAGRYGSAFFMVLLWLVYVVVAGCGFLGYIGPSKKYESALPVDKIQEMMNRDFGK